MLESSYISYLNIPEKYPGSLLHSYEYNDTVGKINEIISNFNISYSDIGNIPRFDRVTDIFESELNGDPAIIHDGLGKLYPVTGSSYVFVRKNVTLDDVLVELRSRIDETRSYTYTSIDDIYEQLSKIAENMISDITINDGTYIRTTVTKNGGSYIFNIDDSALGNVATLTYNIVDDILI